jgi:hypothetical protein
VDLRGNFQSGLDELANGLKRHLGVTKVIKRKKQETKPPVTIPFADLKKFALPGLIALIGLACIGGLFVAARFIYAAINNSPTQIAATSTATQSTIIDPVITELFTPVRSRARKFVSSMPTAQACRDLQTHLLQISIHPFPLMESSSFMLFNKEKIRKFTSWI